MSKRARRDVDIFSMSFLDVVSCGFGAIILLLVIIQISEPRVIEQLAVDLTGLVERLELEIYEIRGETIVLNRDLTEKQEQLSVHREKLARLKGDLSSVRGEHHATKNEHETQTIIENQLATAQQTLSDEVKRLSAANTRRPPDGDRILADGCRTPIRSRIYISGHIGPGSNVQHIVVGQLSNCVLD